VKKKSNNGVCLCAKHCLVWGNKIVPQGGWIKKKNGKATAVGLVGDQNRNWENVKAGSAQLFTKMTCKKE